MAERWRGNCEEAVAVGTEYGGALSVGTVDTVVPSVLLSS